MSRTIKRPYRGSRAFDATCRNHGSCGYCRNNRTHRNRRQQPAPDHVDSPPPDVP